MASHDNSRYQVSAAVQRLQEAIHIHLHDEEKELLLESLNDFNATYNARDFALRLTSILSTPAKLQLVPLIRAIIPSSEASKFDRAIWLCTDVGRRPRSKTTNGHPAPADWFNTVPSRLHMPEIENEAGEIAMINLRPLGGHLGFEISSGLSNGAGIYVSHVAPLSQPEERGLRVGDLILEANDIDFSKISRSDAEKVLQAARSLSITVRRQRPWQTTFRPKASESPMGRQSPSFAWVDVSGRPSSPPDGHSSAYNGRGSFGATAHHRKVSLSLPHKGSLGITIRGGAEHGLGIYISGIDPLSTGELAGIQVGDRIVDVNGRTFEGITHKEAVKILRQHRHMMVTLVHVGKLPQSLKLGGGRGSAARIRYDKKAYPGSLGRREKVKDKEVKSFNKRSGSQITLGSDLSKSLQSLDLLGDRGNDLLSRRESEAMKQYIEQYLQGSMTVDGLVACLGDIFNTYAKLPMFSEVKSAILPQHLRKYEWLVMQKEVSALRLRNKMYDGHISDISTGSSQSEASDNKYSPQVTRDKYAISPDTASQSKGTLKTTLVTKTDRTAKGASWSNTPPRMLPLQQALDVLGDTTTDEEDIEERKGQRKHMLSSVSSVSRLASDQPRKFRTLSSGADGAYNAESHQGRLEEASRRAAMEQGRRDMHDGRQKTTGDTIGSVCDTGWKSRLDVPPSEPHLSGEAQQLTRSACLVRVHKTRPTLGLAIEGGANTRQPLPKVVLVQDSGCAFQSGLQCGDLIAQVNGQSVEGLEHDAVAKLIAGAFRKKETSFVDFLVYESSG